MNNLSIRKLLPLPQGYVGFCGEASTSVYNIRHHFAVRLLKLLAGGKYNVQGCSNSFYQRFDSYHILWLTMQFIVDIVSF